MLNSLQMIRHCFLLFTILLIQPIYCNSDLSKINEWALQWKISFNPDPIKQAQGIIFSRKTSQKNHSGLMFNNSIVNVTTINKYLGMIFDSKLNFDKHLKSVLKKSKTVGLLRKCQGILLKTSLIIIFIISQLLCVLNVYLYIIIYIKKEQSQMFLVLVRLYWIDREEKKRYTLN